MSRYKEGRRDGKVPGNYNPPNKGLFPSSKEIKENKEYNQGWRHGKQEREQKR
jgi:hypothetical protein